MAFETNAGNGYDVELTYTMDNGEPGKLDGEPKFDFDPALGDVNPQPFDPVTGVQKFAVEHNGAVGALEVKVTADGNLKAGDEQVRPIIYTETWNMSAPDGASVVAAVVGAQRPTVA